MPTNPKVAILLATRNGAEFLREQLESFRAQTYVDWELLVSDDASTDGSLALIEDFSKSVPQRVRVSRGPCLGFWQNFVALVRTETDADLFAFSDQDDIWFPEKLQRAVAWFEGRAAGQAALYFTRTELISRDGRPIGFSPLFKRLPSFRNALVQNIGGGNTMVFNTAAHEALCATPQDVVIVSHDWWTYQIVTGIGGVAHYDPWPSLKYRQHANNLVGGNVGFRARLARLFAFASGRIVNWNNVNLRMLDLMRGRLTLDHVVTLDRYARARTKAWPARIWLFWKSGVYRQTLVENFGLAIGALFGKI